VKDKKKFKIEFIYFYNKRFTRSIYVLTFNTKPV